MANAPNSEELQPPLAQKADVGGPSNVPHSNCKRRMSSETDEQLEFPTYSKSSSSISPPVPEPRIVGQANFTMLTQDDSVHAEVLKPSLAQKADVDVPSNVPYSNSKRHMFSEMDEELGYPTFAKSSSSISPPVPEPRIIGQANFTMLTQDDSTHAEVLQPSLAQKADVDVPSNVSYSNSKRHMFSEMDEELGYPTFSKSSSSISPPVPEPCIIGQPNLTMLTQDDSVHADVLQPSLAQKSDVDVPSNVPYSNCKRRMFSETDEELGYPTFAKSLSSISQPEPRIFGQPNFTMLTQDYLVHAEYPRKPSFALNLSRASGENKPIPIENPSIMSFNRPFMPFPVDIGPIGIKRFALSQDTGSIGKIPVPLEISKLGSARTDPYTTPNAQLEPNNLGAIVNKSNSNEFFHVASLPSPLNSQHFETSAPMVAAENIKFPESPHAQKNMQDENIRHFVFVGPNQICEVPAMADPSTRQNNLFPNINLPQERPALNESKPLNQDFKSMDCLGKYFNKSLHEMLSILENWARSGLDNAFNRPMKLQSVHVASLEKKLECGLGLIKEIISRIKCLMTAAMKFSNNDTMLLRGFERISGDLTSTGVKMCIVIQDIEAQVSNDYNNLKSTSDSGSSSEDLDEAIGDTESQMSSGQKSLESNRDDQFRMMDTSSEDTDQGAREDIRLHLSNRHKKLKSTYNSDVRTVVADREAKPNIIITKAYTVVTERLPLLKIQMANFREIIRAFCSEIERLV